MICRVLLVMLVPTFALAQVDPVKIIGEGNPVEWQGWTFKWRILPRQGVVLQHVSFQGKTVLKYAGIAEVFVPYNSGEPRPQDQREHPFGANMIPLTPGQDCLPGGQCKAFSADGRPANRRASVMIHEEAATMSYLGGEGKARSKMLTLWSAYALGDYTYIVRWRFGEDGTIMPQVGLTGRLAHFGGNETNASDVGAEEPALGHVHNLIFCLDFDVDGSKNTVEEFNYEYVDKTREAAKGMWSPITRETGRELKPDAFRSWRVVNHASKNKFGNPRSYEIVPGGTGIYRGPKEEKFTHADLWVTKYRNDEVPGVRLVADGLAACVNNEAVENEDVVTWYMLSIHHQPRTEDFPAMPVDWVGFKIMPRDFLDSSPVRPVR